MWGFGFRSVCWVLGRRWKTPYGFGSLSLDNAGMEASRERGDGAPPPPRPGSMVGRTGPSSVIGSNKGWLRCPPGAGAVRGKSRVSSPRRSSGYPVRRLYPEAGSGGQSSFIWGSGRRAERASATGRLAPLHRSGCSVRRLSSTVQCVFHRLMVRVRDSRALGRGDGGVRLSRGAAWAALWDGLGR